MEKPVSPKKVSRRELLQHIAITGGVAVAGAGLSRLAGFDPSKLAGLVESNRVAKLPTERFLETYQADFKNTEFGMTFSPDHNPPSVEKILGLEEKLVSLDWLVNDLKLHHIRLGIKWSTVDRGAAEELDMEMYEPYFKELELLSKFKPIKITLNVGPIKTNRHPEVYVPDRLVHAYNLKSVNGMLPKDHPVLEDGLEYLDKLFKYLTLHHSELVDLIDIIQYDNEPATQFGNPGIMSHNSWVGNYEQIRAQYLQPTKILLNSAGLRQLPEITTIMRQSQLNGIEQSRFVVGLDFYSQFQVNATLLGKSIAIPLSGDLFTTTLRPGVTLDWWKKLFPYLLREVTEEQTEPWNELVTPGNSAEHFKYGLTRTVLWNNDIGPTVHRLWGAEHLAALQLRKQTSLEHREIFKIIRSINTKN
jgi:hypothetical protein